ncbi:MAG: hypothetical protein WD556_10355 [Actinomycetota bacterium]
MSEPPDRHPDETRAEAVDEPDELLDDEPTQALLIAAALRHLESGSAVFARHGRVAIPVSAPGDVRLTAAGTPVLIYASEGDERRVPSVTWRATFAGWVAAADGTHPTNEQLVPPTVIEERDRADADRDPDASAETTVDPAIGPEAGRAIGDVPDPDPDEDVDTPEELFVELVALEQLPTRDWVSTNELVPKQQRGARYFMPREPRLVRLPP